MYLNIDNECRFVGRVVNDPELTYVGSGDKAFAKARFTLAADKGMTKAQKEKAKAEGKPTADFIPLVATGGQAEAIANYCKKGKPIQVVTAYVSYVTEKDGVKTYGHNFEVVAFGFTQGDSKGGGTGSGSAPSTGGDDFFDTPSDDEIPF